MKATTTKATTAKTCSEVLQISTKLTDLALQFTTSPDIPGLSLQITAAASLSCTEAEKASLKKIDQKFQKAEKEISNTLAVDVKNLQLLSGSMV